MKTIIGLILLTICASAGAVGEVTGAHVTDVRVDRAGVGFAKFDRDLTGTPAACISNHVRHLSFDLKTEAGRAILSLVLTAHAAGKRVVARGTGSCPDYGVVEAWNFGWILD